MTTYITQSIAPPEALLCEYCTYRPALQTITEENGEVLGYSYLCNGCGNCSQFDERLETATALWNAQNKAKPKRGHRK